MYGICIHIYTLLPHISVKHTQARSQGGLEELPSWIKGPQFQPQFQ